MSSAPFTRREVEVLPNQADLIVDDGEYAAGYGGVGAGKTLAAQLKMWKRMRRYPKAGHYVVGADFEQLRGGYFLDIRELLEEVLGWRDGRDYTYRNLPRPELRFVDSNARLRALSAELAERIRSTRIHSLHAEEPQTWHNGEAVWETLVGRMRHSVLSAREHADMRMQAWLTFNPKTVPVGSWLHKLVTNWDEKGYYVRRFSLRDNYLLDQQANFIGRLEDNLPTHLWPVEIDGHFPTTGAGAYRAYDGAIHNGPPPEGFPKIGLRDGRLLWDFDFNVGFQCSVLAQAFVQQPIADYLAGMLQEPRLPTPEWQRRTFYFIDEIALRDSGTEDVLREFLRRDNGRYLRHAREFGVTIYGDASGGGRSQLLTSQSAIRSHWQLIDVTLRENGVRDVEFRVQRANPHVYDRVVSMNMQFECGGRYGALIDAERCPVLVKDLLTVQHKPGTNEILKANKPKELAELTHMSDAAGYMVWVERTLEAQGPSAIEWTMVR